MGRKKISIEKIDCAIKRRTTFAKRSRGLLKKAEELGVLCNVGVGLVIFSPTGKPELFSNRQWINQVLQQFYEDKQEGNEAGMCSDDKKECKDGCCESHLLESENPPLSSEQIDNMQDYWIPDTYPSSVVQNAHWHIPSQTPEGRQHVHMQGIQFIEMGDTFSIQSSVPEQFISSEVRGLDGGSDYMQGLLAFFNGVQSSEGEAHQLQGPSVGGCDLYEGEANKLEHFSNVQSAHNHIQMQQPQVVEAPRGRKQRQMQRVPLVEMGNPSPVPTSVPGQYRSSEVRGPDGASGYMPGPPVGGCEMAFFNGVQPYSSMCDLPGGEADKLEHFSNQPSLQVFENVHIQMPIQHTQQEREAGMSSDDMEEWTSSLLELESFLLESEDPSSSMQLIDNGPPGTNPSSGMQVASSHRHIPMQQLQGREEVQMQGVQSAEMGDPFSIQTFVPGQFMSSEVRGLDRASDCMQGPPVGGCEMAFFNGVQPSSSMCGLSDGDASKLGHFSNVQSAHWHAPLQQLQKLEAQFVHMLAAPFVETGDPSLDQTSVQRQFQ